MRLSLCSYFEISILEFALVQLLLISAWEIYCRGAASAYKCMGNIIISLVSVLLIRGKETRRYLFLQSIQPAYSPSAFNTGVTNISSNSI